jgi:hypothetical protein
MADTPKTKTKNERVSWRNKPYDSSRSNEAHRRAELWGAFNDFVRENRGWITSPPGTRQAILETEKNSELPQKLARLGYMVNELPGAYGRLTGAGLAKKQMRLGYEINFAMPAHGQADCAFDWTAFRSVVTMPEDGCGRTGRGFKHEMARCRGRRAGIGLSRDCGVCGGSHHRRSGRRSERIRPAIQ